MWSYCKACDKPAKHTVMSEQSWKYSFARYLQLSFYPGELGCRTIEDCKHNPHREHVRYFALRNLAVRIYSDRVDVTDALLPRLRLKIRQDVKTNLRKDELDSILRRNELYWNSVQQRVKSFSIDLVSSDQVEAAQAAITDISRKAEEEKRNLVQLAEQAHQENETSSGLALNVARKTLQERVVDWDAVFTAFEHKFLPTEKDFRRLTTNQYVFISIFSLFHAQSIAI